MLIDTLVKLTATFFFGLSAGIVISVIKKFLETRRNTCPTKTTEGLKQPQAKQKKTAIGCLGELGSV
jgi:hypothetical protein